MIVPMIKAYSACTFIGFVMCLVLFTWHLQGMSKFASSCPNVLLLTSHAARNTATCLSIGWVGLACLVYFINSVVWADNVVNWSPVWCDISIHVLCIFKPHVS